MKNRGRAGRGRTGWLTLALAVLSPVAASGGQPSQTLRVSPLGEVAIYAPAGQPTQVVLFLSGDGGWNLGVVPMAERLRQEGALVVGIDIRSLVRELDESPTCAYPAGVLEDLSRDVQLRFKLPAYRRPVIVGYSSGATMAYAALAAAPPETFGGAVSLGFCPDLEVHKPPCQMRGLRATRKPKGVGYDLAPHRASTVPWMVLQGEIDQVCAPEATRAFVAATGAARLFSLPGVGHGFGVPARWQRQFLEAYHAVADAKPLPDTKLDAAPVADLSLVEVPATGGGHQDTLAVILTGDGGWAEIDKSIAAGLATAGIPAVGWSSLDYYWSPRTPEQAAADLARIIEYFAATWKRTRVIVIGYSFGADVAPFLVNRLPTSAKAHVASVALLGPSDTASFEFHLSNWLGGGGGDRRYQTRPEIDRLDVPVTCVSGADETNSVCRTASNPRMHAETVGTGHHFGGNYGRIVELLLR